ncbi:MAG: glycosyltransferase [Gammaproteobacteria bacterium]|nr:glycosyltransferase [Gammaproteobacteria bacterium]
MPLVSVYIPTRNRYELLKRAVQSCLSQTHARLEIIIVDDGSDPHIQLQVQQLAQLDTRIKVILNQLPAGACAARNMAIANASGEFVAGLDDDDEFTPDRIQSLLELFYKNPGRSFVSSGYSIKTASGQVLTSNKGAREIDLKSLLFSNVVGNQILTKTSYLQDIGGFDVKLPSCQDYDTWIRLVERYGPGQRSSEISYMVHQDHGSERISNHVRRRQGYEYLYEKHQHLMNDQQKASQRFYQLLYTERLGLLALLKAAPYSQMLVALKVFILRKIGYDI